jgi:hypothetical protein
MKAFAIFPTLCFFILILTILKVLNFPTKKIVRQLLSFALTLIFLVTAILNSIEMFPFLYFGNFLSVVIIIPCMTYLLSNIISKKRTERYWLKITLICISITIITVLTFAITFFYSMLVNPWDPK